MVYYDSQLFSVDGIIQTLGSSYTIDLSNLMYCILSKAKDKDNADVDTFFCIVNQPNRSGLTQVQYKRNGRTMNDFLSDINNVGGGEPLKLWTNLRSFSGKELFSGNLLYDSTVILNDNFQSNCIYSDRLDQTSVYIGCDKQISPTVFLVIGNQIGSAPLVDEIVLPVYDGLSAQGTTSSTTTILRYGVNVITTVTPSNYAAKLPQPTTGKSVKVINKGTTIMALFPSNVGGQINNLPIDSPAIIPPDGKLYEFICIENPLPGAWTWTAPATAQYDSGDVTGDITLGAFAVISAIDAARQIENEGFYGTTGWCYNGKNQPLVFFGGTSPMAAAAFKPATGWSAIGKIKVYTNMSATNQNVTFGLSCGSGLSYYDPATGNFVTNGAAVGGNYGNPSIPFNAGFYGYCNQAVAGATLPQYQLEANVGDPGTCFGELILIGGGAGLPGGVVDSRIGDFYNGQVANPYLPNYPTIPIFDSWWSGYINFQIQPRVNLTGFKFRFFIEYY